MAWVLTVLLTLGSFSFLAAGHFVAVSASEPATAQATCNSDADCNDASAPKCCCETYTTGERCVCKPSCES
ncbi:MAG: hypothetical protein KatS3mg059_1802 [Thermomicrobiales bacterium]|nr:MAG: hypothetical protein KatS3mg059_1802 [Thermomicrobiales bacterium]